MRSQKQNNKAPRPFKSGNSQYGWSGSSRNDGYIPGAKPVQKLKKSHSVQGDQGASRRAQILPLESAESYSSLKADQTQSPADT